MIKNDAHTASPGTAGPSATSLPRIARRSMVSSADARGERCSKNIQGRRSKSFEKVVRKSK
jgi:hypothetical protein